MLFNLYWKRFTPEVQNLFTATALNEQVYDVHGSFRTAEEHIQHWLEMFPEGEVSITNEVDSTA